MGNFDIFEYIGSNMKNSIKLERLYNVNLDIDENGEPFLDISYNYGKDGENLFIGLKSGVAALKSVVSTMHSLEAAFSIPKNPIITVFYYTILEKYDIEYGGDREINQTRKDRFVVGYIINPKASLSFDEKIKQLYEVMVDCIDSRGFASVNCIELKNPIFKKNCFNQVEELSPNECDSVNQENITLINEILKELKGPQKTKK